VLQGLERRTEELMVARGAEWPEQPERWELGLHGTSQRLASHWHHERDPEHPAA
jgi:hypothetical protein